MKHGAISDAVPESGFRSIQDGLQFFGIEVFDKACDGFLCRDCENPMDLFQSGGRTIFHKAHEGFDGRQSDVSGTGAIAPRCFQMIQKLENQRRINLLQIQLGWCGLQAMAGIFKEKLKSVCIGVAGVAAGMTFDGQTLLEKGCDMRCNEDRGRPPET